MTHPGSDKPADTLDLATYVRDGLANEIALTRPGQGDIYCFGVLVSYEEDDYRYPCWRLVFNTDSHLAKEVARGVDPNEARWNWAAWLEEADVVGAPSEDHTGQVIARAWLRSLGIDPDLECTEETPDSLWAHVGRSRLVTTVKVVADLHESGIAERAACRPVPIIIASEATPGPRSC